MNISVTQSHSFSSKNREGIDVDGVIDVISFDENGVALETALGSMAIEGEGLHVTVLNVAEGRVSVSGRINGVYYFEEQQKTKRGLVGKKNV